MNSHELLSDHLVKVYRREVEQGRHPRFRIAGTSPADGLTTVQLSSEQISESLECQPHQLETFKRLLKQSGIELQR